MRIATLPILLGLIATTSTAWCQEPLARQASPAAKSVIVESAPAGPARDKRVQYDVADLFLLDNGAFGLTKDAQAQRTQDLVDVLLSVMNKRKRGLKSIKAKPGGLIEVTGAPASHEYTRDFLEAQRSSPAQLRLKLFLIELPAGHLTKFGIERASATLNTEKELNNLLREFRKSADVQLVTAPQVEVRPRDRAEIATLNQVSYVADYVLRIVEPGSVEILDPVIEVIEEGMKIDVRAVPVPGGVVQFDVAVDFSKLQRPIPTTKTRIRSGEGKQVEISLPEVDHIKLDSVITLPMGSAALISSAAPAEGKDFAVILHFAKERSQGNPRVTALFEQMRKGTYAHRWFPKLGWKDIPALLKMANSQRVLKSFPTNPLSSQSMDECLEGVAALWLIEGLQEGGNLPSLNPILIEREAGLPLGQAVSIEQQRKLLPKAQAAYGAWWKKAKDAGPNPGTHALNGQGIFWY